jgi:glutamate synthase domain-containing protein 1
VEVFKGVGYPSDVCSIYRLVERNFTADLWIAHTRQPTNSPGVYPVWSHPFASHEWAIAHNGDISSFGANMEFMHYRGVSSFVGTDSELIAYILDYLTRHMPVEKAAAAMVNPFEDQLLNGGGIRADG